MIFLLMKITKKTTIHKIKIYEKNDFVKDLQI